MKNERLSSSEEYSGGDEWDMGAPEDQPNTEEVPDRGESLRKRGEELSAREQKEVDYAASQYRRKKGPLGQMQIPEEEWREAIMRNLSYGLCVIDEDDYEPKPTQEEQDRLEELCDKVLELDTFSKHLLEKIRNNDKVKRVFASVLAIAIAAGLMVGAEVALRERSTEELSTGTEWTSAEYVDNYDGSFGPPEGAEELEKEREEQPLVEFSTLDGETIEKTDEEKIQILEGLKDEIEHDSKLAEECRKYGITVDRIQKTIDSIEEQVDNR